MKVRILKGYLMKYLVTCISTHEVLMWPPSFVLKIEVISEACWFTLVIYTWSLEAPELAFSSSPLLLKAALFSIELAKISRWSPSFLWVVTMNGMRLPRWWKFRESNTCLCLLQSQCSNKLLKFTYLMQLSN